MRTEIVRDKVYVLIDPDKLKAAIRKSKYGYIKTLNSALGKYGVMEGRVQSTIKLGKAPKHIIDLICGALEISTDEILLPDGVPEKGYRPKLPQAPEPTGPPLAEYLATLPDHAYVRIGTSEGSNWLYEGALIQLDVDEVDGKTYNRLRRLADPVKYAITPATRAKRQKTLDGYVRLRDRRVIEAYKSTVDPGITCIVVGGTERGSEKPLRRV